VEITLAPETESRLQARGAQSEFASARDAARLFLDERIAAYDIDFGLDWAKPYATEGQFALDRGKTISMAGS
jgi:hypothetical protein